jgi:hypothetical protein
MFRGQILHTCNVTHTRLWLTCDSDVESVLSCFHPRYLGPDIIFGEMC